jgi:S-adenosyl-L-methionine hydrolase (adenosine-forming)
MPKKGRNRRSGIVTLITDFGLEAEYAGAMKGAIFTVNPKCQVVDITHQILPQDVLRASFVLKNSFSFFPKGTIHVVVVDPGVGTERRPLIVEGEGHLFVGPDNGVFSAILSSPGNEAAYEITRREFFRKPLSSTFHGRDLFAPVAGHLSRGESPQEMGRRVFDCRKVEWPQPRMEKKKLIGQILWADPFGNLITNISRDRQGPWLVRHTWLIRGKNWKIKRLSRTYGEGEAGRPLALFGSSGLLELSINQGRALDVVKKKPGDPLIIELRE